MKMSKVQSKDSWSEKSFLIACGGKNQVMHIGLCFMFFKWTLSVSNMVEKSFHINNLP